MGRKKIKIANIVNNRQKHITFMRRKAGIIKKCHELAILCNARVMLMVWDEEADCHVYATESADKLMQAYEAAYLGVGDRRLAEYEVEQVGEGSEDLVVKRVSGGQPFMRDRYIPRSIVGGAGGGSGTMGMSAGIAAQQLFSGCSTPNTLSPVSYTDLSPDLFRPPSLLFDLEHHRRRNKQRPLVARPTAGAEHHGQQSQGQAQSDGHTLFPDTASFDFFLNSTLPAFASPAAPVSTAATSTMHSRLNNATSPLLSPITDGPSSEADSPLKDKDSGNLTFCKALFDDDAFLRDILNTDF